jgi:hypothetical protein
MQRHKPKATSNPEHRRIDAVLCQCQFGFDGVAKAAFNESIITLPTK